MPTRRQSAQKVQKEASEVRGAASRLRKEVDDLARAASEEVGRAYGRVSNSSVTQMVLSNIAIVLLVFSVVVIALAVWMGYDAVALGSSTGWPDFALVGLANALLVGIAVGAGAYCAYLCVKCSQVPFMGLGFLGSLAAPAVFMLAAALMLTAFYFFFLHGDVRVGFWLMLAALVPAVLLMLMAWKCSSKNGYSALWASLPFVIVFGILAWLFWRTHDYTGSSLYGTD